MAEPYVEELSDCKCPLCGLFYSVDEAEVIRALKEHDEERWPCCFRCVLASPDLRLGTKEANNEKALNDMLSKFDSDYDRALERKFAKNFVP
jgi:hypothetical protein